MRRQSGMSFTSMAVLLVVVVIVVKTAMTLVPMFWDNRILTTILNSMAESRDINADMTKKQFEAVLNRHLNMNDLELPLNGLEISKHNGTLTLDWSYEARRNWIGPVDMAVRFNQHKEFTK